MAITVEDGTGLSNADAFISVAYYKTHADARGTSYSAYTDALIEQAIVRATDYLSESFHWAGYKLKERGHTDGEQALAWPRSYVVDRNGYSVANDEVPTEIEKATAELTTHELANIGSLQPAYTAHDRARREKVGPIEIEYDLSRTDPDGARPVLLAVRDLVGQFLASGAGTRIAGEVVRV